jgi:hypothetical protein
MTTTLAHAGAKSPEKRFKPCEEFLKFFSRVVTDRRL